MTKLSSKIILVAGAIIAALVLVMGTQNSSPARAADEPTGACYRHDVDVACKDGVTQAQCDSRTKEQIDQGVLRSDYWVKGAKCDSTLELVHQGVSYDVCMKGEKFPEAKAACLTKLEKERQAQEKLCKAGQEFKVFYPADIIDTSYDPVEDECHVTCSLVGKCIDKPRLPIPAPAASSSPKLSSTPTPTPSSKMY